MGQLNLYKIDEQKVADLQEVLDAKYSPLGEGKSITQTFGNETKDFLVSFYLDTPDPDKRTKLGWEWLVQYFDPSASKLDSMKNPRGVLLIESEPDFYACTYGYSYFNVDKFCDTEFAFNFARRIEYENIKRTTLSSPSSKRNKVVNTYIDYNTLEFESGESFAKLKVKIELPDTFTLFGRNIEIGRSIRVKTEVDDIATILKTIMYIEDVIANEDEKYKIPLFLKVTDEEVIEELNTGLSQKIDESKRLVNLSELDIIGATEIFNTNDSSFELKCGRRLKELTVIDETEIQDFINACGLTLYEGLTAVKIVRFQDGQPVKTEPLYNMIDYCDDEKRCLLVQGQWYYFNDDYLGYLEASMDEIPAHYTEDYDFSKEMLDAFWERMVDEDVGRDEHSRETTKKKPGKIFYREHSYNTHLANEYGFKCYDREIKVVGNHKYEIMDLYDERDGIAYAVKFGNASSVLCYAVDQSLATLKIHKHSLEENLPDVRSIGIWLVLERKQKLQVDDGKIDINQLNMLTLKNKLDDWKRAVRLAGYVPIVRINYYDS